jgi:hypothetical protein
MALSISSTGKYVTSKARNVLYTRLGDIPVGTAYFWFILLGLLANFFTMILTWAMASIRGITIPKIEFGKNGMITTTTNADAEFD